MNKLLRYKGKHMGSVMFVSGEVIMGLQPGQIIEVNEKNATDLLDFGSRTGLWEEVKKEEPKVEE